MKREKPLPWWEEYLGVKLDLRAIANKMWKAYLGYIITPIVLLFTDAPTVTQARPNEVAHHTPSQSQSQPIAEPMRTLMVATTNATAFSVSKRFIVNIESKQEKP
jgi:hypothetical protein